MQGQHGRALSVFAFLNAVVLAACAGNLENPERFADGGSVEGGATTPACPDMEATVLIPSCATAGCHNATSKAGSLDLSGTGVAARLSGKAASGGGLLVDPTHPDKSVLYTKTTTSPPYGSRMPLGGKLLDDATSACLLAYVSGSTQGSSNNAGSASKDAATD
jgi:hypothetical protein